MILELLLLLTFYILQPFADKEPLVQKASIKQQSLNIVFLITTFHNDVIIEYENSISLNLGEKPATFKARLKPAKHRGVVKPQVGRSIESSEKRANLRRIKRRFHLFGPRWPSCPDISSLIQAALPGTVSSDASLFDSLGCTLPAYKGPPGQNILSPRSSVAKTSLKGNPLISSFSFQDVDLGSVNLPFGNGCPCSLRARSRTSCPFSCQRFVGSS